MNNHDDEHDYQPTRDEILDRYGWKPGEREQLAAEMAERQARIKRDETLARCEQRVERPRPAAVVEKTFAQKKQDEVAATKYWQGYIRQQLDSANMALTKAVAQAIVNSERQRDQADFDLRTIIIDVRNRFDEMDARLGELEARMSKRRGAASPACDGTPRDFDRGAFNGWRQ